MTLNTFGKISNQIISERLNKDRLVRRRTSQVQLAFDFFFKELKSTNPDISFFFTNHVASSLHRYWPSIFPNDYEELKFDMMLETYVKLVNIIYHVYSFMFNI